jgi:tRNA(Ile)-lysidine synthase
VSAAEPAEFAPAEIRSLFADLADRPVLVLAVSGGPDSTALLVLAARWRKALRRGPKLVAVTVDHGLRPEAKLEAAAVARLARELGVSHHTLRWRGRKPLTGLQAAARAARYRLLADAARSANARHVLTAHTLDDQAETVLIRLTSGSGIGGLAAMARVSVLPEGGDDIALVRPFLEIPKARLLTMLRKARVGYADDPSNSDPRFTRVRMRDAMQMLEAEGLSAARLAVLARRARRADAAVEHAVDDAMAVLTPKLQADTRILSGSWDEFRRLPAEVALRLLGRAIDLVGDEGPVELGKLEALLAALDACSEAERFRRTLAGAIVTRARATISVERAPARRSKVAAGKAAANRP